MERNKIVNVVIPLGIGGIERIKYYVAFWITKRRYIETKVNVKPMYY